MRMWKKNEKRKNWEKRWEDGRVERRETAKRIWLATLTFLHAEREHCLSPYPTFLWSLCFLSSLISSSFSVMSILNRLKERLPRSFVLQCVKQLLKQRRTKKRPNVVMLAPGLLDRGRYLCTNPGFGCVLVTAGNSRPMRPSLHSGHGEEEVRDNEMNTATLKSVSVQGILERHP